MKSKFFLLNLFMIVTLVGTVACNQNEEETAKGEGLTVVATGDSDPVVITDGTDSAVDPTKVDPEKPEIPASPPPVSTEPGKTTLEIADRPTVSAISGIALPEDTLKKAHQAYAAYAGVSELGVELLWKDYVKEMPRNLTSLNQFLKFVYAVDPAVRKFVELAQENNLNAHQALNNKYLKEFDAYVVNLTTNNRAIGERILWAAKNYGVALQAIPTEGILDAWMTTFLADYETSFLKGIFYEIGVSYDDPALSTFLQGLREKLRVLYRSVGLEWTAPDGAPAYFAFENFRGTTSSEGLAFIHPFLNEAGETSGGFGGGFLYQVGF